MKKHRQKIALVLALALAFGSAAASAANYSSGRGAMPSFAGAGDAFDLAMGGASKASNWLISRARTSVGSAFSYAPPESVRPPPVAYSPETLPSFPRGGVDPTDLTPHWRYAAGNTEPDRVRPQSFDDGVAANASSPLSVDMTGLPLPGPGGSTTPVTPTIVPTVGARTSVSITITSAVPELPPYALLLAGLGLLTTLSRRRRKA